MNVRVRELRQQNDLTQRQVAASLDVTFTYISKVENGKLHHGDYRSEAFILKLAETQNADADELLLLAEKSRRRFASEFANDQRSFSSWLALMIVRWMA